MKNKKILNMKLKDLKKYCDNNLCKNCPFQCICIYECLDGRKFTAISIISNNAEKLLEDDK